jgi:hypothetical protein
MRNENDNIEAVRRELEFMRGNPNLVHDIRQESVDRALAALKKIESALAEKEKEVQ